MKHLFRTISIAALVSAAAVTAHAQTVVIKDAKIVTASDAGTIENGTIVITNGKITNIVNRSLDRPNSQTITGENYWATPGLVLPLSQIGIVEVSLESSTNDTGAAKAETSVSDLAVDGFNPQSPVIDITRIEGITHAVVKPSARRNIFGGTGLVADTTGTFNSVESEQAFVFVQMGSGGADLAGGSRPAAFSQLRAALNDASAYPARYQSPTDGDTLPRRDAAALAKAARGQMPLIIAADRASDLLRIIELKKTYSLDVIIAGAAEAWMVADELAEAGIRVMIDPMENLPGSFDQVGARLDNAKLLADAGVDFAIYTRSSGLSHNVRLLPQHAGNAVAHGLDWDTAFAAISSTPANWFGIGDAELERGADTVVVWDGDPLDVTSSPVWMMVDGEVQPLRSRQTDLRDRYNPTQDTTQPHKYR